MRFGSFFILALYNKYAMEKISNQKVKDFIGKIVTVSIDRPLGSTHPKWGYKYPINYGFISGIESADGEDLDAYIIGPSRPLTTFTGICVAIIRRLDDNDDKLIVVPEDKKDITDTEIEKAISFQEKFFTSKIIRK